MSIHKKPTTIEVIAPDSVYPFQKIDKIITGQNVAAIPDQPKITNQKTVLVGDKTDTLKATTNAKIANIKVTFFDKDINLLWLTLGFIIC